MTELIESGDPRAKVVGRQRKSHGGHPLAAFDRLQKNFHKTWGTLPFRRGIYRFKSHDQFEEWKTNLMIRNSPARR